MNAYNKNIGQLKFIILFLAVASIIISCKKFVDVGAPETDLIRSTVFANDETAKAALAHLYYRLQSADFSSGRIQSLSFIASLCSDEMQNYNVNPEYPQFNTNDILSSNTICTSAWSESYEFIYKANAILEGIESSSSLTDVARRQLKGEALFIRSFANFYLLNLYGNIPLANTTDYLTNKAMQRTSQEMVYQQIITDLKEAQELLNNDFSAANGERVRANKGAVAALLARVYLFTGDWINAELQSTILIDDTDNYELLPILSDVFKKNSKEAIFQLWSEFAASDYQTFTIDVVPTNGVLREEFVLSFDDQDVRASEWIGRSGEFYFPTKYKSPEPDVEYSTIFRLAEQYLIRAEARARQNKISGANSAEEDLNAVRARAGLLPTVAADKESMLSAIYNERKFELFTEWGHRWFDLKRTQQANLVLGLIKPDTWQITDTIFPIPAPQIINSPISQNPGYNE